jgi:hypothetical protein
VLDELGVELELNSVAIALEPVLEALVGGISRSKLDSAVGTAAAAIWDDALRDDLDHELRELRNETLARIRSIELAARELDRPAAKNRIARALVFRAAAELLRLANRNRDRMEALEESLRGAPPGDERALRLPCARAAIPPARTYREESDEVSARFIESFPEEWEERPPAADHAAHWLARRLATDERRHAMRRALAELARGAEDDFPLAAMSILALTDEPMLDDPAEDDLWVNLAIGLVQEQLGQIELDE